jgi:hypothetical protein
MSKKSTIVAICFTFYIVIVVVYGYAVKAFYPPEKLDSPGTFGDMFGAFNAVVAGLGFMALLANLYMQHLETTRLQKVFEYEKSQHEKNLKNKHLSCLKSIKNELSLYLDKIRQLHNDTESSISALEQENFPSRPTYDIYTHLLEQLQIKLVEFENDEDLTKAISVAHYELSHIKNRLHLYKCHLDNPPRIAAFSTEIDFEIILRNTRGFRELLTRSLHEYPITIKAIEDKISKYH